MSELQQVRGSWSVDPITPSGDGSHRRPAPPRSPAHPNGWRAGTQRGV